MERTAARRPGAVRLLALFTCMLLGAALVAANDASAVTPGPSGSGVVPITMGGNPSCQTFDPQAMELKDDDPPFTGSLTSPYGTVSYSSSDGVYFDWTSTRPLDAVFVKGGNGGNLYNYAEATGDTHLHSPINPSNGRPFGISHISFCFDLELDVTKTARTSFTRTYSWEIDKRVAPATWDLFAGDTGTSTYDVSVRKTGFADSDFAVAGTISIANPHVSLPVQVTAVTDVISGGIPAAVTCPAAFPFPVAPQSTVTCTYSASLPDASDRQNTATVVSGTFGVKSGTGKAAVSFLGATVTEVNASIDVSDTNGASWTFADTGSVSYPRTFACDRDRGRHDNTATIVQTGQSADAAVVVRCHALAAEKTAETTFTRTFLWQIEKSVAPAAWELFAGDSGVSRYRVGVDQTGFEDSDWAVAGTIAISNPSPLPAVIASVADLIQGGIPATVNCGGALPITIAPGGRLECAYSASLPDAFTRVNIAEATQQNHDRAADGSATPAGTTVYSATAVVSFGAPTSVIDAEVTVSDSVQGPLGLFAGDGSVEYPRTFACDRDEGEHANTATIDQTGQSASASVTVACHALAVSKNAETTYTRTFEWSIDKSVAPASWDLFAGDTGESVYRVSLVKDAGTDSAFAVAGSITISNPAPVAATLAGVTDEISGYGPVAVDCPSATVPAGGELVCTYEQSLPDKEERQNTATAGQQNHAYDGLGGAEPTGITSYAGSAAVRFGEPTTLVRDSVTVDDTNGSSWTFSASGTQEYSRTFACGRDEGTHPNTATIAETGQSDEASVSVACHALAVEKTATTSYTRTFGWKIDKSVSPAEHDLFRGDSASSEYVVSVEKDAGTDSDWAVSGSIAVSNPAPIAATVASVADLVNGSVPASVDCGGAGPYTIAAGGTLECSYTASLGGAEDGTNVATATQQNHAYAAAGTSPTGTTSYDGSAPVDFGDPTRLVNDSVTVQDTNGSSWSFSGSGSERYSETFSCDGDEGSHGNTATIAETGASDSASVAVRCHALRVEKDARTRLTRTYAWTVDKSASTAGPLTLSPGQAYAVDYTVAVAGSSRDSDWGVSGGITVTNPAPMAAPLVSVADAVSGVGPATVDCGVSFPYSLPAGGSLRCTYDASLPDAADRTNEATATLANAPSGSTAFGGTAAVSFGNADVSSIDECVAVSDSQQGVLGSVCAPELQRSWSYTRLLTFTSADCGELTVPNDASATTNDRAVTTGDSWSIPVTVACRRGCTLTPGYWKTHSESGKAPYDDAWLQIGPAGSGTTFLWNVTYYQALSTPVAGNAWWILSRAYVAATMNGLNGADTTAVASALAEAYALLAANDPSLGKAKGSTRTRMVELAGILDAYNNGVTGPGHCSEDSSSSG